MFGCTRPTAHPAPTFTMETNRSDDKIELTSEPDQTIFSIRSPFGISRVSIERNEPKWPNTILLRLHLSGLESLQLSNGLSTLDASVSSSNEEPQVRVWRDQTEDQPLDRSSSYWMEIRMFASDKARSNKIPLKDGYFEMQLPSAFLESNPKSIEVRWIDFYRG